MRRRDVWVGQDVTVAGLGGKWHVSRMEGLWIWVIPLDTTAQTFGRLGSGAVGFRSSDLNPYIYLPGEPLP